MGWFSLYELLLVAVASATATGCGVPLDLEGFCAQFENAVTSAKQAHESADRLLRCAQEASVNLRTFVAGVLLCMQEYCGHSAAPLRKRAQWFSCFVSVASALSPTRSRQPEECLQRGFGQQFAVYCDLLVHRLTYLKDCRQIAETFGPREATGVCAESVSTTVNDSLPVNRELSENVEKPRNEIVPDAHLIAVAEAGALRLRSCPLTPA